MPLPPGGTRVSFSEDDLPGLQPPASTDKPGESEGGAEGEGEGAGAGGEATEAKARAEGGAGEAGATGEAEKKQQEEEGDDGDAGGADTQAEALRRRDSRRQSLRLTRVEEAKALDEPANNNVRAVWMARLQHAEQVHWQMFPGASDAMRQASDAKDNESSTSGHDIYNNDDSTIYTDTGG